MMHKVSWLPHISTKGFNSPNLKLKIRSNFTEVSNVNIIPKISSKT